MPVEGYDRVRRRLKLSYGSNEGRVRQEGRERMRVRLRAGESFVFESNALTRTLRSQLVNLATDYGARVRILHVEATPEVRDRWNADREEAVPLEAFLPMLDRWEFPAAVEAHRVEAVVHRDPEGWRPQALPIRPWGGTRA